jgi:hypothetical protein
MPFFTHWVGSAYTFQVGKAAGDRWKSLTDAVTYFPHEPSTYDISLFYCCLLVSLSISGQGPIHSPGQ